MYAILYQQALLCRISYNGDVEAVRVKVEVTVEWEQNLNPGPIPGLDLVPEHGSPQEPGGQSPSHTHHQVHHLV